MKTVVITGASGDIGFALCKAFLQNGYNVVASYNQNDVKPLESYANDSKVIYVKADVSKKSEVISLFNIAHAGYFSSDKTLEEYNSEIWHLKKDE